MSQQTPTGYVPIASAMSAANTASRALVAALTFQSPQDGMMIFCTEVGFQGLYVLSLNSGAVVDGTDVLSTTIGGASRWLKIQIGPVAAPVTPGAPNLSVQFDNGGAFGGIAEFTAPPGFMRLDTAARPLQLGAAGWAGDGDVRFPLAATIEWGAFCGITINGAGNLILGADPTSALRRVDNIVNVAVTAQYHRISGNDRLTCEAAGVAINGTGSYGGGTLVVFLASATLAPAGNPVGGGILYVDALLGLVFKGTAGTVTPLAPM